MLSIGNCYIIFTWKEILVLDIQENM